MLRTIGFSVLVLLLIAKVIGVILRGPSPLVLDAGSYWDLGGMVADGDWLLLQEPIAYRTPGYPWLVGLFRTVFTEPLFALIVFQSLLWLATIGLVVAMAIELSGTTRVAEMTVGIAVVMVSSVIYVSTVLTETVFVFFVVLHLWSLIRFCRVPSIAAGVLVAIALALAILIRPVAMLIWIPDAIYLLTRWYWIPDPAAIHLCRRRGWICVSLAAIVVLGCLSPWLARNHAMFGKVMLTEFVGRNVWIVAFQGGSGAGFALPNSDNTQRLKSQLGPEVWQRLQSDESWRHTWSVSKALAATGMPDPAIDRLMKAVAVDAIFASPLVSTKKTAQRMVNFWRTRATRLPDQVADLQPPFEQSMAVLSQQMFSGEPIWGVKVAPVATAIRYRWSNWLAGNTLLMFATIGSTMLLIVRRPTRAVGLWLGAILGYFATITAVLEIPDYRYRMIIEPVVLLTVVLAAATLFRLNPISTPIPAAELE